MSADVLEILSDVQIVSRHYYYSELGPRWSVLAQPEGLASFHILSKGTGVCRLWPGGEQHSLSPGGLVLLPHGDRHLMCDSETTPPEPLAEFLERTQPPAGEVVRALSEGEPGAVMVCGIFEVTGFRYHPVFRRLPRFIHQQQDLKDSTSWLRVLLEQVETEVRALRPGYQAILSKLFDVIFCQILRSWFSQPASQSTGWLAAFHDPRLSSALRLIHRQPGEPWTVASLANAACMSRSQFAQRFQEVVGTSPVAYLGEWRLWRSYQALRQGQRSLSQVARDYGFSCESALARAMRRDLGLNPSEIRRSPLTKGLITV